MTDYPRSKAWRLRKALFILPLVVLGAAALGAVLMLLWNALMPAIFGLKAIHFWQALGLLALSKILFGGFHHHRHGGRRLRERWARMSPEERERFRERFQRHCGAEQA